MDCITISDDSSPSSSRSASNSSGFKPAKVPSVASLPITINSDSTQRCPVTWNSVGKKKCTVAPQFLSSNVTPMLKSRVNMWLSSTMQLQHSTISSNNASSDHLESGNSSSSSTLDEYFNKTRYFEESPKRNILIRHDFNKDDDIVSNIRSYKPKWMCHNDDNTFNGHYCKKEYENSSNKISNPILVQKTEKDAIVVENNKKQRQKVNNNEVPLSPESQKKNELCSYLQLMNMSSTDKKMANKIQNRRSTRVKNLIIMSEKKELERKLNIEAMEKQKDNEKSKIPTLTSDEPTSNSDEPISNSDAPISNSDEPTSNSDEPTSNSDEPISSNSDGKKEALTLRTFNKLDLCLEEKEEKYMIKDNSQNKLLNVKNIPQKILTKHSDFDETMKIFIAEVEDDVKKQSERRKQFKKHLRRSTVYLRNIQENDENAKMFNKHASCNLKNSSDQQSVQNLHRKKLKMCAPKLSANDLKKGISHLKQNLRVIKKNTRTMLLRHNRRQNLRSKLSLSEVGIKTLILKDKYRKNVKVKSPFKKRSPKILTKSQQSSVNETSNKIDTPKNNSFENSEDNNRTNLVIKQQPETVKKDLNRFNDITIDELKSSPKSNLINVIPKTTLKRKLDYPVEKQKQVVIGKVFSTNEKKEILKQNEKTEDVSKTKDMFKTNEDFANNFKEKSFNVIDLSHSKPFANMDTLNDHNYTLKSNTDKGYIMNVILGTSEKSPMMESMDNKLINDDLYCKSPETSSACKEGEYCRETLEEIIGIPWRSLPRKNNKNKDDDCRYKNDFTEKTKEVIENPTSSSLQFEYNSYSESLLLNSSSSSKMFNIRLPLLEPPTNIFDEGPCSPSQAEHPDEVLQTRSEELVPIDDLNGKSKLITMTVPPEIKSLHKSLMQGKRKIQLKNPDLYGESSNHTWDNDNSYEEKRSHSIKLSWNNGNIMNAFYVDFNLVIVQEQLVSFWSQSALGNMLGSQDLWISKGTVQRLLLDSNCVYNESSDMVINLENSFAYIELWTKEHKSDKRERPLSDVFATVYFWRHRQAVPDKKVLQLENINGKDSDVQYIVLRNSRNIVVSWVEIRDDMKKTVVHCYSLAPDYQTVVDIREMDTVDHCVTSLHNIEDCNNMVMGFGEENITLWNLEYGYVVATIEVKSISINPRCLWIKCDRGFLFILQYYQMDRMLILIAVNGINHSWKRLQVFHIPSGYEGLRGICIDNNILAAFFQRGVLCWNIQTGESVIEEMSSQTLYLPCDKHVIMLNSDRVHVQHFLSYFVTSFDLQ